MTEKAEMNRDSETEKSYVVRRDLNKTSEFKAVVGATIAFIAVTAFFYGLASFSRPDLLEVALSNKVGLIALFLGVGVAVIVFTAKVMMLGSATFEKVSSPEGRVKLTSSLSNLARFIMLATYGLEFTAEDDKGGNKKEELREDLFSYGAVSDGTPFEAYISNILKSLSAYATSSEITARKLLDKGVAFMAGGLVFYVLAIVVWQVFANLTKPDPHVMYVGMAACSMTFIVVEFLAAWFFKQYRYYVEVSLSCLRVRSVYDRYLLGYYALREFEGEGGVGARNQMAEILKEDVKWPTYKGSVANDFNYMMESMGAAHTSIEKMKEIFQPKQKAKPKADEA